MKSNSSQKFSRTFAMFRLLLPAIIGVVLATAAGAEPYFSMASNNNVFTNAEYLPKLAESGAEMCRVDIGFSLVRKVPGTEPSKWNWKSMEDLRAAARRYPQIKWLPILGYGTGWAADPKFAQIPGDINAPQKGINVMPVESPANLYGNYVYETVNRYKDVVHSWESWNEPDLPDHAFFKGNGQDFFPYQRACYLAAKKADPNCKVAFAGLAFANIEGYMYAHKLKPPTFAPAHSSFFEEYLQAAAKDPQAKANNYYFDVVNQHSYSRATDLADYSQILKKMMRDNLGQVKPIWFTETGFPDDGGAWGGTPTEYCDYLVQSFCWATLSGVQKQFHFQLDNSNGHGLFTGMLGPAKPAFNTYKMMTHDLNGAQMVSQLHGRAGVGFLEGNSPYNPTWTTGYNLFELKSTDGKKRIFIAFTDTNKPVDIKIPAKRESAMLIDRLGNRKVLNSLNSFYQLHLPGATNLAGFPVGSDPRAKAMGKPEHLVGGATQIVIEQ
ncbi:hypothetical protein BH10CYA1_BH10CYA1_55060 [soil metagenome]